MSQFRSSGYATALGIVLVLQCVPALCEDVDGAERDVDVLPDSVE